MGTLVWRDWDRGCAVGWWQERIAWRDAARAWAARYPRARRLRGDCGWLPLFSRSQWACRADPSGIQQVARRFRMHATCDQALLGLSEQVLEPGRVVLASRLLLLDRQEQRDAWVCRLRDQ